MLEKKVTELEENGIEMRILLEFIAKDIG